MSMIRFDIMVQKDPGDAIIIAYWEAWDGKFRSRKYSSWDAERKKRVTENLSNEHGITGYIIVCVKTNRIIDTGGNFLALAVNHQTKTNYADQRQSSSGEAVHQHARKHT